MGNTYQIPLSRGMWALVDVDDIPLVLPFKWAAHPSPNGWRWYARAYSNPMEPHPGRIPKHGICMQRLIMGFPYRRMVWHKSENSLDNRRSNLELRFPPPPPIQPRRERESRFRGVYWCACHNRWRAGIGRGDNRKHLGRFRDEEAAAKAYDAAAIERYGESAVLNFQQEQSCSIP